MPEDPIKRGREKRDVWAKRVERWKDSGLTCSEFCAEVGVNPRTLKYWSWRLQKDAAPAAGGAAKGRRRVEAKSEVPAAQTLRKRTLTKKRAAEPTFMEVVTAPPEPPAEPVEITVRSVTVRVPQTAAADLVRRAFDFAEKLK